MICDILQLGDARLREVSQEVAPDDSLLAKVWTNLDDTLHHQMTLHDFSKSAGLSAVQIGYMLRACIVQLPDKSWRSVSNPQIIEQSEEESLTYEGCLSFFDKRGLVPRSNRICLQYLDRDAKIREETLEGWAARIILHEIDHMDGVLYTDRMRPEDALLDIEEYRKIANS